MADGYNQVRAVRISELMEDYRKIQSYMSSIRANPSAEESSEEGYALLNRCVAEARALLSHPFQAQAGSKRNEEEDKIHLKRIMIDAALRRFKVQKTYLRATAALRWINARQAILQGQRPHARHAPALQQIRNTLRTELASITDAKVELSLRSADAAAGKWIQEDPNLQTLQCLAARGN